LATLAEGRKAVAGRLLSVGTNGGGYINLCTNKDDLSLWHAVTLWTQSLPGLLAMLECLLNKTTHHPKPKAPASLFANKAHRQSKNSPEVPRPEGQHQKASPKDYPERITSVDPGGVQPEMGLDVR